MWKGDEYEGFTIKFAYKFLQNNISGAMEDRSNVKC